MKSNETLGFTEIGSGSRVTSPNHTVELTVGRYNKVRDHETFSHRAYCTLYRHSDEAEYDGVLDELAARSNSPYLAMGILADQAADQWSENQAKGVRGAIIQATDEIAEG